MSILIHIGFWGIDTEFGLVGKIRPGYEYKIPARCLWKTFSIEGRNLYLWPVLLMRKYWIYDSNADSLFTAFFFAQEYFKAEKPDDQSEASWPETIFFVKSMLQLCEELLLKEHSGYKGERMVVTPELYEYALEVLKVYDAGGAEHYPPSK
ncbi:hypothetical protein [Pararcticibacter amylolyticus]|uniref:Uncharacterized protein n=1 Tax=Pararcticibacter amylolyticus TaxID=2173175 RepID=A0A2U2PES9_9SPHI|nr:hypothetical protein [Pararcticibacter amylolyticus]PWG79907.1 hypothetical protein DDR33_13975 [Pararcticibacter amylolyticus]